MGSELALAMALVLARGELARESEQGALAREPARESVRGVLAQVHGS